MNNRGLLVANAGKQVIVVVGIPRMDTGGHLSAFPGAVLRKNASSVSTVFATSKS
jgi:hypothetical protein